MTLLELQGVSKRFHRGREEVVALHDVSITVEEGEFVGMLGRSGSGKSTLLHLAGGLDQPDAGTIRLAGNDLSRLSIGDRAKLRRREVGFVFQFFHLIPTLTVAENVELPLTLDGVRDRNGSVRDMLDRVGLGHRVEHLPGELSGGEMQRAAIARALVANPKLILADEPTGNLDSATGEVILDVLIGQVRDAGASLLMVTHDPAAAGRADRELHLKDGQLIEQTQTPPAAGPQASPASGPGPAVAEGTPLPSTPPGPAG